jgi:hypothetical protein
MNQIVTDVVPIDLFTIEPSTLGPDMWIVWGHGDNDFVVRMDIFSSLDKAEEAYPNAVTVTDFDWPSDTIPQ